MHPECRSLLMSLTDPMRAAMEHLPPEQPLPNALDVVFGAALRHSRAAALDELLSLNIQAVQRYAKVGMSGILHQGSAMLSATSLAHIRA